MKYCDEMESLLSVYFDGECTPEETAQIRAHLKTCAACRQRLREYAMAREHFPDDFDVSAPADLSANVMAAIRSGRAPQQKRRCGVWKKVLLPLAACLVLALALPNFSAHFLQNQGSTAPEAVKTTVSSSAGSAKQTQTTAPEKKQTQKAEKTLSSQKSSVSESAAPDSSAASSGETADFSSAGASDTTTYGLSRAAVSAPYHKWISVTAEDAGSLLDNFDGTADTDPVSGKAATRYEMSADDFASITEQLSNAAVHVNKDTALSLCCVYVLSSH
jgi:hypothetical protein